MNVVAKDNTGKNAFQITPYQRQHRQEVLALINTQFHVHTHLDWFTTDQWLEGEAGEILLAWQDHRLLGIMGTSQLYNGMCWLRLVAIEDNAPLDAVFISLWQPLLKALKARELQTLWVLLGSHWLNDLCIETEMEYAEMIVTLKRISPRLPPLRNDGVQVRSAEFEDLSEVLTIDNAAFAPPWQMNMSELRQAMRIAESFTIAEKDEQLIGYQISTRYRDNAHLARLAVLPNIQSAGVGGAMLHHMIPRFRNRGINTFTVNTQRSNIRSQHLYSYYGYRRNGYDIPVWKYDITAD